MIIEKTAPMQKLHKTFFFSFDMKSLPLILNVNNAFYYYYFESTKKKIKYYEIFLLEKKKNQPIQFLQHNFTSFCISFHFFPYRFLRTCL